MSYKLLLDKSEYRKAISYVKPIKIAVAYLGIDFNKYLNPNDIKKIIISPTLGSNYYAIHELVTEIGWDSIFFLNSLHSKIFLGKEKAVIGSANLTNNALSDSGLYEAGIFIENGEKINLLNRYFEELLTISLYDYPTIESKKEKLQALFMENKNYENLNNRVNLNLSPIKLLDEENNKKERKTIFIIVKESLIISNTELDWSRINDFKEKSWIYQVTSVLRILDTVLKNSKFKYNYISWDEFSDRNFQKYDTLIISHREITGQGKTLSLMVKKINNLVKKGCNLILLQDFSHHLYNLKNEYWSYHKDSPRYGDSLNYMIILKKSLLIYQEKLTSIVNQLNDEGGKDNFSWTIVDDTKFDFLIVKEAVDVNHQTPTCISYGCFQNEIGGKTYLIHVGNIGRSKIKMEYFRLLLDITMEQIIT